MKTDIETTEEEQWDDFENALHDRIRVHREADEAKGHYLGFGLTVLLAVVAAVAAFMVM